MNFDPNQYRKVRNFISYLASQSKSLKTMAKGKRSYYDVSISLLAVTGIFEKLFPIFYFMLFDVIIDIANPLLEHPGLDEKTRSKVQHIRSSASDMDLLMLAKAIVELERIRKQLP